MQTFRKIISLFLFYTLTIGMISGIVLYIAPHGSVASMLQWKLIGLDKHGWEAVHIIFGFIMVVAGFIHLYFNWKPFISYIKQKTTALFSKTFIITTALVALILAGTIYQVPPFSSVINLSDTLKRSWEKGQTNAQSGTKGTMGGFGRMTLNDVQENLDLDDATMDKILAKHNINNDRNQKIRDIAGQMAIAPFSVYELFRKEAIDDQSNPSH
jgi:hypothetical protein